MSRNLKPAYCSAVFCRIKRTGDTSIPNERDIVQRIVLVPIGQHMGRHQLGVPNSLLPSSMLNGYWNEGAPFTPALDYPSNDTSSKHLLVNFKDGRTTILDEKSKNGTRINRVQRKRPMTNPVNFVRKLELMYGMQDTFFEFQPVPKGETVPLAIGDRLILGADSPNHDEFVYCGLTDTHFVRLRSLPQAKYREWEKVSAQMGINPLEIFEWQAVEDIQWTSRKVYQGIPTPVKEKLGNFHESPYLVVSVRRPNQRSTRWNAFVGLVDPLSQEGGNREANELTRHSAVTAIYSPNTRAADGRLVPAVEYCFEVLSAAPANDESSTIDVIRPRVQIHSDELVLRVRKNKYRNSYSRQGHMIMVRGYMHGHRKTWEMPPFKKMADNKRLDLFSRLVNDWLEWQEKELNNEESDTWVVLDSNEYKNIFTKWWTQEILQSANSQRESLIDWMLRVQMQHPDGATELLEPKNIGLIEHCPTNKYKVRIARCVEVELDERETEDTGDTGDASETTTEEQTS